MGLTRAQRINRMADRIYANKAEFDRLTENDKCANYGVYCAHIEAIKEDTLRTFLSIANPEVAAAYWMAAA